MAATLNKPTITLVEVKKPLPASLVPAGWGDTVREVTSASECREAALALAHAFAADGLSQYLVDSDDMAHLSAEQKWRLHVDISMCFAPFGRLQGSSHPPLSELLTYSHQSDIHRHRRLPQQRHRHNHRARLRGRRPVDAARPQHRRLGDDRPQRHGEQLSEFFFPPSGRISGADSCCCRYPPLRHDSALGTRPKHENVLTNIRSGASTSSSPPRAAAGGTPRCCPCCTPPRRRSWASVTTTVTTCCIWARSRGVVGRGWRGSCWSICMQE